MTGSVIELEPKENNTKDKKYLIDYCLSTWLTVYFIFASAIIVSFIRFCKKRCNTREVQPA